MTHIIDKNECIGCSACSKLCPVFAISGTSGQPFHINEKRCVDCGVCGRVCPQYAIKDQYGVMTEKVSRSLWQKPVIDEGSCSACGICKHWCTPEAIELSKPAYQGDIDLYAVLAHEKNCIGCGLCERYCPLDAIRMVAHEKA